MNYYLYIIYPVFFFFLFLITKEKRKHPVYTGILIMYLLSTVTTCLMLNEIIDKSPGNVRPNLFAIVYHCVMFWLLLTPFKSFDKYRFKAIGNIDGQWLSIFTIYIVFFCVCSLIDNIPKINLGVLMADVQELRTMLEQIEYTNLSLMDHIVGFAQMYGAPAMALAFYNMIYHPEKKWLIFLLLICSAITPISGMKYAAREYLIKYLFTFIIVYLLTKDKLPKVHQRGIYKLMIAIGVLFVSFFVIISFLRFGGSGNDGSNVISSLLVYFSEGFAFFSAFFTEFPNGLSGGSRTFPVLFGNSSIGAFRMNDHVITDLQLNMFNTTVGSFVTDMGVVATVFVVIIYRLMFTFIGKLNFTVFTLTYMIWCYEFIFSALFFHNFTLSSARLLSILMIVFFDFATRGDIVNRKPNKYRKTRIYKC